MPDSTLFDYTRVTVASVEAAAADAIARADRLVADVAAIGAGSARPTFVGVLGGLDRALAETSTGYGSSGFMGHVHRDAEVRDAGMAAEERLTKWRVELPFNEGLYASVAAFARTDEAAALSGERRRLLDHWLREFRRAGQELPAAERARLRQLRARLVELEVTFERNIGEYRDQLEVTREELDGLPDSYVERLKPGATPGTYQVGLEYPQYLPFMDQARRRDLRQQLEQKDWNRASETNLPVLEEALALRRQVAGLLGYPSWAHYAIEVRMAREPEAVRRFYAELVAPLGLKAGPELAVMTEALRAETGDDRLRSWDVRYYENQLRRTKYGVDGSLVAEYFPLEQVMTGMLELTGEVFGLEYRQVADTLAWHPDVRLLEIVDRESGEVLADAYVDLFPRDGKFTHAAAFPLVVGHRDATGARVRPVSAIVANFTPPSGERPSLLRHDEVVTLFHEFGHILHMSLSQAEFVRFSGGETESDFVEAPSQIMEHWAWNADVLRRFARHYRTGEPIATGLIDQLVAARDLNVAVKALRQASFGYLDLAFHDERDVRDVQAINREAYAVTGLQFHEGTFYPASFGHLMGGYDAGYYGYLWSKVYGDDMFSRFTPEGVTSPEVGRAYRREILEPNGAGPAEELLRRFLGREPNNEAFLRLLGIEIAPGASSGP